MTSLVLAYCPFIKGERTSGIPLPAPDSIEKGALLKIQAKAPHIQIGRPHRGYFPVGCDDFAVQKSIVIGVAADARL